MDSRGRTSQIHSTTAHSKCAIVPKCQRAGLISSVSRWGLVGGGGGAEHSQSETFLHLKLPVPPMGVLEFGIPSPTTM